MNIIGITACTAGVAHTYMAQAALQKVGKEMGHACRIETQGAMGIEDELTDAEIDQADLVIIGADISVEGLERFDGKPVYKTTVAECVSNTQDVFDQAIKLVEGK